MDVEIFESEKKNLRIKNNGILVDGAETNSDSTSLTFCLFSIKRGIWTFSRRSRAGKCRDRARVKTEMVELIVLPFPFSSKLKLWSFHVVVVQGLQRN